MGWRRRAAARRAPLRCPSCRQGRGWEGWPTGGPQDAHRGRAAEPGRTVAGPAAERSAPPTRPPAGPAGQAAGAVCAGAEPHARAGDPGVGGGWGRAGRAGWAGCAGGARAAPDPHPAALLGLLLTRRSRPHAHAPDMTPQIAEQFEALGAGIGVRCAVLVGGIDMMAQARGGAVAAGAAGRWAWMEAGPAGLRPKAVKARGPGSTGCAVHRVPSLTSAACRRLRSRLRRPSPWPSGRTWWWARRGAWWTTCPTRRGSRSRCEGVATCVWRGLMFGRVADRPSNTKGFSLETRGTAVQACPEMHVPGRRAAATYASTRAPTSADPLLLLRCPPGRACATWCWTRRTAC